MNREGPRSDFFFFCFFYHEGNFSWKDSKKFVAAVMLKKFLGHGILQQSVTSEQKPSCLPIKSLLIKIKHFAFHLRMRSGGKSKNIWYFKLTFSLLICTLDYRNRGLLERLKVKETWKKGGFRKVDQKKFKVPTLKMSVSN